MSPRTILWLLGGITVLGLALRLPSFDDSLWGDELTTYGMVSGHGPRTVVDLVRTDLENTPPLFYLVAWATERLGGPEGLRLSSLLAGVAAIPLTYLLGARTVGRPAGLAGAGGPAEHAGLEPHGLLVVGQVEDGDRLGRTVLERRKAVDCDWAALSCVPNSLSRAVSTSNDCSEHRDSPRTARMGQVADPRARFGADRRGGPGVRVARALPGRIVGWATTEGRGCPCPGRGSSRPRARAKPT